MDEPKVVEFKPLQTLCAESCVDVLRDTLERAERGEFIAVAIATIHSDGCAGTIWSRLESSAPILGAIGRLAYKINKAWEETP